MEIVDIAQYGNNCYSDLLKEFQKFKTSIQNSVNQLETFIKEFIKENSEEYTFCREIYEFVEKNLQINDFVNSIRSNTKISNNSIESFLKNNSAIQSFQEEMLILYSGITREFQEKIGAIVKQQLSSPEEEDRHHQIEIIDKLTIRRNIYSSKQYDSFLDGRWIIQCLKRKQNIICQTYSIKFTVLGSDIIFGIASFEKIKKNKFELTNAIIDSYFIRQDGIHFGFGITETEQEFSPSQFSARRNEVVLVNLKLLQKLIIVKNQTTGIVVEFQIPKIPEDWCFIFGLRFENERVVLEK